MVGGRKRGRGVGGSSNLWGEFVFLVGKDNYESSRVFFRLHFFFLIIILGCIYQIVYKGEFLYSKGLYVANLLLQIESPSKSTT